MTADEVIAEVKAARKKTILIDAGKSGNIHPKLKGELELLKHSPNASERIKAFTWPPSAMK